MIYFSDFSDFLVLLSSCFCKVLLSVTAIGICLVFWRRRRRRREVAGRGFTFLD